MIGAGTSPPSPGHPLLSRRSPKTERCCFQSCPPAPPVGDNDIAVTCPSWPKRTDHRRCRYLSLHLQGEVLEHVVQFLDAALQLQDLVVPGLDLIQSLPRRFSVTQDLNTTHLLGESWTRAFRGRSRLIYAAHSLQDSSHHLLQLDCNVTQDFLTMSVVLSEQRH